MPDFSGWTGYQTMEGNSNCRAWADWETTRVFRNGQAGWDVRIILKANKTTSTPTYGTGNTQVGAHETDSSLETKYMTIAQSETTFRDETLFVSAEAGADVPLAAYANIIIPNVVSKGIQFTVTAKRNLWGVYFDANGGSGAPSTVKRHWGEIVYIPTTTPYKSGYSFKGWTKTQGSSTIHYSPGDPIGDDADVTLYAVWQQNTTKTWTITYNANGGSNAPSSQTANVGQSITVTYSQPTRSGHSFLGWSTWSGSTSAEYTGGSSITSSSNMTLYAVWKENQTAQYSLSFNLNGGTGYINTVYGGYGSSVQIPYVYPKKTGYTFKGWSTSSTSTIASYQPGDYYTLYWDVTLYAVWQYNSSSSYYTITYNANGGSGAPASQSKSKGIGIYLSSTKPTKSGHSFLGWSTSSTATTASYQPGDYYNIDADLYLYAVWKKDQSSGSYSLSFNLQGGYGSFPTLYGDYASKVQIPSTSPTKNGYTFRGWATSSTGSASYQPGDYYTLFWSVTLYAVWEEKSTKKWTITYNANGGNNAPASQTATVGEAIVITYSEPFRIGYEFLGWSTWSEADYVEYKGGNSLMSDSSMVLYAVWKEVGKPEFIFDSLIYELILNFDSLPNINLLNFEIKNPSNSTFYYKICYVDNYNGDVADCYVNGGGTTYIYDPSSPISSIPVDAEILRKSIINCNNENDFKIAVFTNYTNNFDANNAEMKKTLLTVYLINYQKPIIKSIAVTRTGDGGAQLDAFVKYANCFQNVPIPKNGCTVYINNAVTTPSDYTVQNKTSEDNLLNALYNYPYITSSSYSFRLSVSDGYFSTSYSLTLGVSKSDGNVYIYSDGRIEAAGFVRLKDSDESEILFKPGGYVYAKEFKQIANGVYLCPDVFELVGKLQKNNNERTNSEDSV